MTKSSNKRIGEDEMSAKEFILKMQGMFRYLVSKWLFLIIIGLFGGLLGFFYAKNNKVAYIATTTFVLESGENNNSSIGQMAGLAALAGIDLGASGGGIFQGDNLFELYKSRKMIESVLLQPSVSDSTILLVDRYIAMEDLKKKWSKENPELTKIDFAKKIPIELQRDRDSILQNIVKDINEHNLSVGKLDKKSSLIKVDVQSTDEMFSKEFNDALVAQVNDFYIKTKTKKSLDNIAILQRKTDSVRMVMNGNISTAAIAIDVTPNLNPARQAQRIIPTQRSQFSAETNKAILSQLVQNLEMSKMALMKETPLIQKVDEPVLPLTIESLSKIKLSVIGAFLFVFLTIIVLIVKRLYDKIVNN